MEIANPFGAKYAALNLPDHTRIVAMAHPERVTDARNAIADALRHPIASPALATIARQKATTRFGKAPTATIVVSDNTRPVPYKGDEGILLPIIEVLVREGYRPADITVLIATGTHRAMSATEIERMLDAAVLSSGVRIVNHDCHDEANLVHLGATRRGTEINLNRLYVEADLKIATGLVESHFMAGASGGRKAICPGIIGEKGTYVFHSAPLMADRNARDLNLTDNPVHEESVEVATKAGIDFLVNVTVDSQFHVTGIFAGDFVKAHEAAVGHLKKSVQVKAEASDIVVTHAGFVGINHYQCAKCGVASLGILKKGGYLVMIADTTDAANPVGSINYRTTLALLKLVGGEAFLRLISSPDWTFIPEQWQVQQWAKVFERIPQDHLIFYAPQMDAVWWPGLPGLDGRAYLEGGAGPDAHAKVVSGALDAIAARAGKPLDQLSITYINDGPYVIPVTG
jgi:nickel-dependent lactate racemase